MPESAAEVGLLANGHVAGVTGHLILELGPDSAGHDALAVWHVDAAGQPVGASIATPESLAADQEAARRLLGLTTGRSVLGWDTTTAADALGILSHCAGVVSPVRLDTAVLLPEVLGEIEEQRQLHADAIEAYRVARPKGSIKPIAYPVAVPTAATSAEELRLAACLAVPVADSGVAARALLLARLTRWSVNLWHATETARLRRKYLVEQFGDEAPLPPRWLAKLRAANTPTLVG